jgi:hypothetical protein
MSTPTVLISSSVSCAMQDGSLLLLTHLPHTRRPPSASITQNGLGHPRGLLDYAHFVRVVDVVSSKTARDAWVAWGKMNTSNHAAPASFSSPNRGSRRHPCQRRTCCSIQPHVSRSPTCASMCERVGGCMMSGSAQVVVVVHRDNVAVHHSLP